MYELWLVVTVCILFLYLYNKSTLRNKLAISKIPGPSLLGILVHLWKSRPDYDIMKIVNSIQNKYGSTFSVNIKPFSPIIVTSDRDYFGQVLTSKEYLDKPPSYDIFKYIMDNSLVLLKEIDVWKNDRKILNEVFREESFKTYLENLGPKLNLLEETIEKQMSGPIDMQDLLHTCILHTIVDLLKDPSVEWDEKRSSEYAECTAAFKDYVTQNVFSIMTKEVLFNSWHLNEILGKEISTIKQFGVDLVDAHLKSTHKLSDTNIIYSMYKAGIPYERIAANVILFMEAGHETTATTLAYLLYEIAKKPDIQRKICAEVDDILGTDKNATISPADLKQMKYVHCVVKEGLRRHTSVSFVMRKLKKPAVVNDVFLPEGTSVIFFIDGLQKCEKYYKDPLDFNPDRFSEENKDNLVSNTWTPFGLGIRNCIGTPLAMQKVKLILARLVRRFEFAPVPGHELDIRAAFLTRSASGIPVYVKSRNTP